MSRTKLRRIERLEQHVTPPLSEVQVLLKNDPDFERKLAEAKATAGNQIIIVQFVRPPQDGSVAGPIDGRDSNVAPA